MKKIQKWSFLILLNIYNVELFSFLDWQFFTCCIFIALSVSNLFED